MVAFWVDEELQGGIEVAVALADGTDVVGRIIFDGLRGSVALHGWE